MGRYAIRMRPVDDVTPGEYPTTLLSALRALGITINETPLTDAELHRKLHDRGLSMADREAIRAAMHKHKLMRA